MISEAEDDKFYFLSNHYKNIRLYLSAEAFIIGASECKEFTGVGKYEVILFCGFTWV